MAKKSKINIKSFNIGIEAAAMIFDSTAAQYQRLNLIEDAARHAQWALNIRRLKKHEPAKDNEQN